MIRQTNRSTRSDAAFWKTARLELMARKIRGDGRGRRESESDVSDGHKAPKKWGFRTSQIVYKKDNHSYCWHKVIFCHCYFIVYSSSTGWSDHCTYLIWLSIPCFHWDMAVGLYRYRYGLLQGSRSPMLWALTKWFSDIAILLNILLLQAVLTIVHTSFGFQFHVFTEIWLSAYTAIAMGCYRDPALPCSGH